VGAFCIAPILWAAGSLLAANVDGSVDRVAASAIQMLSGGTTLLIIALAIGQLNSSRWSGISWVSVGAAGFLLVFDSIVGFVLYTRLLDLAPTSLVSTYAYVTPLVGTAIGVVLLDEQLWLGALVGGILVVVAVGLELRGGVTA
jgi:drug/metabolite transporter (DMT)-like permease